MNVSAYLFKDGYDAHRRLRAAVIAQAAASEIDARRREIADAVDRAHRTGTRRSAYPGCLVCVSCRRDGRAPRRPRRRRRCGTIGSGRGSTSTPPTSIPAWLRGDGCRAERSSCRRRRPGEVELVDPRRALPVVVGGATRRLRRRRPADRRSTMVAAARGARRGVAAPAPRRSIADGRRAGRRPRADRRRGRRRHADDALRQAA